MTRAPLLTVQGFRRWWILAVAIAVLPLMINNDSFWIDEGATALHASQPTFGAWWNYLNEDPGGDAMQPLGMFFSWLTGRLMGTGEWQLRSVNLLWGVLSLWFVWRAGRNLGVEWLPLLFVVQPFFWFHTNDARPYVLQLTCGTALLWAFTIFLRDKALGLRWCVAFTAAAVVSYYATALAPIFVASLGLIAVVVAWRNHWRVERKSFFVLFVGLLASVPATLYYAYTIRRGTSSAKLWDVDLRYLGYVGYDLGGASGLGPPADQLRLLGRNFVQFVGHRELFLQFLCGILLLLCIAITFLAFAASRKAGNQRTLALILIGPFLLEVAVFFALGLAVHKNLWPRHLNIAFPFYVAALGVTIHWSLHSGSFLIKASASLLIALLLWSSFRLRYSPMYTKEDYRWATAAALQVSRQGHVVWWAANKYAARHYGLTLVTSSPKNGEAFSSQIAYENDRSAELPTPPVPDDIFVSRPDVHDLSGAVGKFIKGKGYRLQTTHPSFEWWVKQQ